LKFGSFVRSNVSLTIASWSSHTPQNKKINSGYQKQVQSKVCPKTFY
jgi:hypothetical protein